MLSRVLTVLILLILPTHAVIVAQGDGTQNLSAPADDFGWANVILVQDVTDGINVTGVYLGNGWILSSYHGVRNANATGFQFGSVFIGGDTYFVDPGSATRLHNQNASPADLALFRLTTEPALPSLTLATSSPTNGRSVVMMGNGLNREADLTQWNVNTNSDPNTWTEVASGGTDQGYKWSGDAAMRWGTNNVAGFGGGVTTINVDDGFGVTSVFRTIFDNNLNEAQAAPGDSGGAVFWKVGGEWQLGGIMLFTVGAPNQPSGTSVFDNATYAADLSNYRAEIASIVPEPSSLMLGLLGAAPLFARRRRRCSRPL
jgi:hypothetical protein